MAIARYVTMSLFWLDREKSGILTKEGLTKSYKGLSGV